MLYFVGHIIRGEAGKYHTRLTQELSEKFDIHPLHLKVPPHLTFKAPFKTDTISNIQKVTEQFIKNTKSTAFTFDGFGNFRQGTIYINVKPSVEMVESVDAYQRELFSMDLLQREKFEPSSSTLHASVARKFPKNKFDEIWEYIRAFQPPNFKLNFDSIAILEHDGKRWNIHSEFCFQPTNS